MEIPSDVQIHNQLLGMKGTSGRLLQIADGYYELICLVGGQSHRVLLPVAGTAVIRRDPEVKTAEKIEIEL